MDRSVPPAQISGLIKTSRWGLLFLGVIYGSTRKSMLTKREQKRLAELERTRPEREAKARAEKEKTAKEQLESLGKELGTKI